MTSDREVVTDTKQVWRPKWARDYDVGDEISYYNPRTQEVESTEVVGFSNVPAFKGQPVINKPDSLRLPGDKVMLSRKDIRKNGHK